MAIRSEVMTRPECLRIVEGGTESRAHLKHGSLTGATDMQATEAKLVAFLKKSRQFIIPIYQRAYSWTEKECRQLWDDIVRTGGNDAIAAHFVGSIVYIEKGLYQVSSQSPLLVIDGQQRLTTVTLLIAALAKALGET